MPRQSTRVKYKTRKERDKRVFRTTKLILLFTLPVILLLMSKNWESWMAWFKSFFQ
ncbi:MAG: hypothetical protein AAFY36_01370 [Bacteroidota bacterium]